jgi:hypothetical protein
MWKMKESKETPKCKGKLLEETLLNRILVSEKDKEFTGIS